MKKITFFLGALLMGVTLFSSCSKDESEPVEQKPSLTLQVGSGFVSQAVTVTTNSDLKFGIRAMANSTSNAKLTELIITRTINFPYAAHHYHGPIRPDQPLPLPRMITLRAFLPGPTASTDGISKTTPNSSSSQIPLILQRSPMTQ